MSSQAVPGSCLCGTVRFEIDLPTMLCAHCHCTMCRRAHGAGYVTWVTLPPAQFRLVGGEDRLVRYRSSEHATRSFCGVCGSSLFFESANRPDQLDVVLANFTAPIDRDPEFHVYFDDRAAWVHVGDDLPRLGGVTGMEPL